MGNILCNSKVIFTQERAPCWSYLTQINCHRISTKTTEPLIDPHISHSGICRPFLHTENITLYFTRGLRTEHLLSWKEQLTGKVCTANMSPLTQGFVNMQIKQVTDLKPYTLAVGKNALNVSWIQSGPVCVPLSALGIKMICIIPLLLRFNV